MHAECDIVLPILSICLSVCLSVHCQYCNGHIITHFGMGVILVYSTAPPLKNSRGTLSGMLNTRGGKNFQILPLFSETVRDRAIVTMEY